MNTNATQPFSASVMGTANLAVTWQVNNSPGGNATVGTISSSGLYTAPASVPNPASVMVMAVSQADPTKSGSAQVTITTPGTGSINQQPQSFPIELGTSGGDSQDLTQMGNQITCCSGTLGALVSRNGNNFILSVNHVIARRGQASNGENIIQPGLADTNCNSSGGNVVANLSQAADLKTSNVDAAIAQIVPGAVDTSGGILEFSPSGGAASAPPAGSIATAGIGEGVAKSGRSTGLTCSSVQVTSMDIHVDYQQGCSSGSTFTVTFTNQVVIGGGSFSASGDSGSLIVDSQSAQPVGLLYAGNDTSTAANPIQDVLNALPDPSNGVTPAIVGGGPHTIACPAASHTQAEQARVAVPEEKMSEAAAIKERHAAELLAIPGVLGAGVGRSEDHPGAAAVIVYVEESKAHGAIPVTLEGIRTRVILTSRFRAFGTEAPGAVNVAPQRLDVAETARGRSVKQQHAPGLMALPGIIGVGVGASKDAPGEAALVIYVDQNSPPVTLPAQFEGVRTQIVTSRRFRAFRWGREATRLPDSGCAAHGLR